MQSHIRWARLALLTISTCCIPVALEAADETPADQAQQVQEVIITGSRIPVPANITSTSPITSVSQEEIQLQGHTDMTDILNELPQTGVMGGVDFGNTSNPLSAPGGTATVDLRGLGPQRTLVLVNGRRLGAGDPNTLNPNPAPDIDQIPTALVERIDVLTGGASAVYGSDAMAGVVNFILRRNFTGVEVDGQYGFNDHTNHDTFMQQAEAASGTTPPNGTTHNGYKRDLSIVMGTNTAEGNGNVTGYFAYHHQDGVPGSLYDYGDCLLGSTGGKPSCENSANSNEFTVAGTQNRFTVVGNQFLPWPQAGSSPPSTFNSSAYENQEREDDRYQGGLMAHIDLNEYVKPYMEFSFMNDKTTQLVAPSGLFNGGNPFTADNNYRVNCTNPFLSAQELGVIQSQGQCLGSAAQQATESADLAIGRRNIEGGGRDAYYEHTNYRAVGGIGGKFLDAWTYDTYAQYYYTSLFNSNTNYLSYTNINNALQVTGTAANPVCVSGSPCVPYNIFNQGAVTPAQLAYLEEPGTADGNNTEKILHADVTGDLGHYGVASPWAHDGVGVNVGAEHRMEALSFQPDAAELSGELAGFSGAAAAINQSYHVNEAFTEILVPLVQDAPWAHDLQFDTGYRYSNYSTAGVTNTYKFEVQYSPIRDFRLRGSFDRAVRAPNLIELYNPQAYANQSFVGTDPCAPTVSSGGVLTPATATLAQCEHTGVTAAEYGNGSTTNTINQCVANQCGQITGGNPHLQPEVARTWSLGVTLNPEAFPGLYATIDYYHIAISGEVSTVPANYLFDQCLDNGTPQDCSQVVRSSTGSLHGATVASGGYIIQTNVNAGASLVSGIDVSSNYRHTLPAGWGSLMTIFNGTWVQHDITTPFPGATSYDCAGLYGSTCTFAVHPTWRHVMRETWETPWKFKLSTQWRFIGGTSLDGNSSNPALQDGEFGSYSSLYAHVPSYSYLDLTAVARPLENLEIRLGVNNVLDKDPPLLPTQIGNEAQNNTYNSYDTLGRQLYVAFTVTL
jgi:iron complex outermembrane recepter protein